MSYDLVRGIEEGVSSPFVRGDCNNDGDTAGVTDAIFHLSFNFPGADEPGCRAACDVNADGDTGGVSDAIALLTFNFLGGAHIPAPFPECGASDLPTDKELGCDAPAAVCR